MLLVVIIVLCVMDGVSGVCVWELMVWVMVIGSRNSFYYWYWVCGGM